MMIYIILTINETQITFTVKEYIDEHLNGKMGKIIKDNNTDNVDEYILLYKNDSTVKDLARYISPNSKLFVEVIGAGNFVQDSKHNAKGNIYISGSPELLKSLRRYIKFTAKPTYDQRLLRNLVEDIVEAEGEKNDTISTEKLVLYNVTYTNQKNLTIIDLKPNNDFTFSEDLEFSFQEEQLTVDVDPNINLYEISTETPDILDLKNSDDPIKINPSSFEIEFNTSNPLNISSSKSYFKYPANIENETYEEIICELFDKTNINDYYKISCSTRKTIIALVKKLRIVIHQLSNTRGNLQANNNNNKIYYFPPQNDKIMKYEYSAKTHDYFRTSKSKGLSAGAIVAIILSSIAALMAVGLVFFFLRKNQSPPVIKNQPDFNVINSTSNINN